MFYRDSNLCSPDREWRIPRQVKDCFIDGVTPVSRKQNKCLVYCYCPDHADRVLVICAGWPLLQSHANKKFFHGA